MNPSLRQLRAFALVAERASFTQAALEMHLTPSALSVLVRELERALGTRLFDRHTRSVQLSDAGRDFYPHVQRIFNELADAVVSVEMLRDKRRGLLRVAAPQLMASTLMPPVMADYRARYPDVQIKLSDTMPDRLLEGLLAGEVELAVGPDGPATQAPDNGLARQPLFRDKHWLICRPDHALAGKRSVKWRDLLGSDFIAPTRDFMQRLQPELTSLGKAALAAPAHEVSYMSTAIAMVAAGHGVTACPSYSQPLATAFGLEMRPIVEPEFFREVCIFSVAHKALSPAAASFVECMHQNAPPLAVRIADRTRRKASPRRK
jgi:DNA-binding transcriptional LysR family regulator